jgi:hypothetical protein
MSEVNDGVSLQAGDTVEFVVVTNQRNGKSYACNVSKIKWVQSTKYIFPASVWFLLLFIFYSYLICTFTLKQKMWEPLELWASGLIRN